MVTSCGNENGGITELAEETGAIVTSSLSLWGGELKGDGRSCLIDGTPFATALITASAELTEAPPFASSFIRFER